MRRPPRPTLFPYTTLFRSDDAERNLRQLTLPVGEVPRALSAIAARAEEELARTLRALADAWDTLQPPRTYSDGLSRLLTEPEGSDPTFLRLVVSQVEGGVPTPRVEGDLAHTESGLLLDLDDTLARVMATFPFGNAVGTLAVVGPSRMRYPAALTIAHEFRTALARPWQE